MTDTPQTHVPQTQFDDGQPYEPPELTVVGELGRVTQGSYSRPHSDDGDAGGYWG